MKSQSSERMTKSRALLLGVLVVVATVAVVSTLGGDEAVEENVATPEAADDGVVEVAPLIPANAITAASWRDADNARQAAADAEAAELDEGESTSLLDQVEFGDDKSHKYEKSVEKTVRDIEGLGVYVAPETDVDEPPQKKKKRP